MKHRPKRVGDHVRQILARLIREDVRDPRVGFVTLTDVRLSSDLRHACAYVSFLEEDAEIPLEALRRAAPFLRGRLAKEAGLRHVPELRFEVDAAMTEGFNVERILKEVGAADIPAEPSETPETPEDDSK